MATSKTQNNAPARRYFKPEELTRSFVFAIAARTSIDPRTIRSHLLGERKATRASHALVGMIWRAAEEIGATAGAS